MPLVLSTNGPVPRWFKIIRICNLLLERQSRGIGDKVRQRRTLARWQKFDRMRREECPSLGG
jgi:hypothetical protein